MTDVRCSLFGDRILVVLIGLLAVLFVVMAGPFIVSSSLERVYNATRTSELHYTLTLTTSSSLHDVTLFVPLPTDKSGSSPIIQKLGAENMSAPIQGFTTSIFGANNESYIRLSTEYLPGPTGTEEAKYIIALSADSPALNTLFPLQYDYTLLPKQDLTEVSCGPDANRQPLCFQYQTLVYAAYTTGPDAQVRVQANLAAANHWTLLGDYTNGYTDSLGIILQGNATGWHTASGNLVTGLGDANSYWKERVEQPKRIRLGRGVDTSMMRWHTFTPLP